MSVSELPRLIRQLYAIVAELNSLFEKEGRRFTPDGHLVGSIGEVLAKHRYGLRLLPGSSETHDALTDDMRKVQIKATQGIRVASSSKPDHLIVLKIKKDGSFEEIYNGPGELAWEVCGKRQKNGQSPVSISRLKALMQQVPVEKRLGIRYDA